MIMHTNTRKRLVVIFYLFWVPLLGFGQRLSADTVARLDAYFENLGPTTPGASVIISRSGQIIYEKYVGMADLEHNIPVTPDTRFEAGSVSKQFAATAILMLVRDGQIRLEDEVQQYIPELPVYDRPITVRHLVQHTSGLKDWGTLAALGGWGRGTRVYTNDIALKYIVRQPTLNHSPGDEHLYSNSNYTLMTHIVERVSGQSLAEFTAQRIFEPLGMEQTLWRTDYRSVVPRRAIGYSPVRGGTYQMNMPFENTYGHAALLTTARDLNRWNESWAAERADAELLALRTERGVLTSGDSISYAGGVRIDPFNGRKLVHHSGITAGYRAWLSYFPEEKLSIVLLSNDGTVQPTEIGEGLAAVFFGKPEPIGDVIPPIETWSNFQPSEEALDAVAGSYVSDAVEGRWTVERHGSHLRVQIHPHSNWITLKPTGPDLFAGSGVGVLRFMRESGGTVQGLNVSVSRARNVWFDRER